jgi:8-oxo-dGTP diphosphatase
MVLATLVYIRSGGRTLMMHRVKRPGDMHWGKWNGLGGKVKPGETPEECAVREVREESGLSIEDPRLRGFITFPAFDQFDDWYVFLFTADGFSGTLAESDEGHLRWVEDGDLRGLDLWEGDHVFMPWLEQERVFSAKICYEKGKLSGHEVIFY